MVDGGWWMVNSGWWMGYLVCNGTKGLNAVATSTKWYICYQNSINYHYKCNCRPIKLLKFLLTMYKVYG
jgi:hypothetical protein